MGRYLVVTVSEDIAMGEKDDMVMKFYATKPAAMRVISQQRREWSLKSDPKKEKRVFAGVYDVKKGEWL